MADNQKNPYLIPGAIIAAGLFIAAAVFFSNRADVNSGPANVGQNLPVGSGNDNAPNDTAPAAQFNITEADHIRGNPEARITIVEFSDFQCPFCQSFHPTLKQVLEKYPDQVNWVYKHFPLDQPPRILHPNARPAAEASECAAEQGKFWEFSDGLFENQSRLGSALYSELASQIELDMNQFDECVSSRKYKDKVQADYQEGIQSGVTGTPGSFVNGRPVPGAVPLATLEAIIEAELNP